MDTRSDFSHFTQIAFNKPFKFGVERNSCKVVVRNGLRLYLYNCLISGTECIVALTKRLHEVISYQPEDIVYIHSHTKDEKYNYSIAYDYFKAVEYDIIYKEEYEEFCKLT